MTYAASQYAFIELPFRVNIIALQCKSTNVCHLILINRLSLLLMIYDGVRHENRTNPTVKFKRAVLKSKSLAPCGYIHLEYMHVY